MHILKLRYGDRPHGNRENSEPAPKTKAYPPSAAKSLKASSTRGAAKPVAVKKAAVGADAEARLREAEREIAAAKV